MRRCESSLQLPQPAPRRVPPVPEPTSIWPCTPVLTDTSRAASCPRYSCFVLPAVLVMTTTLIATPALLLKLLDPGQRDQFTMDEDLRRSRNHSVHPCDDFYHEGARQGIGVASQVPQPDERTIQWITAFDRLKSVGKHRAYLRRSAEIVGVGVPEFLDLGDAELRRALNGYLADDSQLWPGDDIVNLQPELFYELNATHFSSGNLTENFKLFLGAYVVYLLSPYASTYLTRHMLEDMDLASFEQIFQQHRCVQALEDTMPLVQWQSEQALHDYRLHTWKILHLTTLAVVQLETLYGDAFRTYFSKAMSRVSVNAWNMTLTWDVLDSVYSYVPFDRGAVFLDLYIKISARSISILKKSLRHTTLTVLHSPGFATLRLYRMLVAREVIVPNFLRMPPLFDLRHPLPVLVALVATVICRELIFLTRFILFYDEHFKVKTRT
ncbi:hypothetical protein HPB50_018897 [Hyalomma asiaticum]|uniref:Uncharacterized protein n=1 Tax=Hyalomma asiaticum TaxID=266040 RepID=A0ACB7RQJ8_HYAAI|nr:hypothetical protein HPB50_018897 [Hyalomma asiaticum]